MCFQPSAGHFPEWWKAFPPCISRHTCFVDVIYFSDLGIGSGGKNLNQAGLVSAGSLERKPACQDTVCVPREVLEKCLAQQS